MKQDIVEAPTLYNPYFKKYFLLYNFSSDTSIIVVLTQKDGQNNERLIYFMSASLQGPKINYPAIDKKVYVVYKDLNHFQQYLFKYHCIIFVPHPTIIPLFVQQELGEIRVNWMAYLKEYEL